MKQDISREDLQAKYDDLIDQAEAIKKVLAMYPAQSKIGRPVGSTNSSEESKYKKSKREVDESFVPTVKDIIKRHGKAMTTDEIFNALTTMDYKFRTSEQPRKGAGIALGNAFRKGYLKRERIENDWVYKLA